MAQKEEEQETDETNKNDYQDGNLHSILLTIKLKENRQNISIKGQNISKWIQKQCPAKYCLQDAYFEYKCRQTETREWKKS